MKIFIQGDSEELRSLTEIRANTPTEGSVNVDYKDIGLLLLSGRTTGMPRLVPRRYCDHLYVVEYSGRRRGLAEESIYLAASPMSHNFPLRYPGVMGTLFHGEKIMIYPTTGPDEIIPPVEGEKITIARLVPAMANMCIELLEMDECDISSLELIQVDDPILDQITAKKIERGFSRKFQQTFGIAEGLIPTTSLDDGGETVYNTQNKPISGYDEAPTVDEGGKELPVGEYRELIVRDSCIIYGYYDSDEVNKNCVTEDCYSKTDDKARKLKNDDFQIIGGLKKMINKAGEKVIPTELEEIPLTHDKIVEVQVMGIPDRILEEKIGVSVLSGDNEITLDEIGTFLKEHGVAHFKLPGLAKKVNAWPLTSVGKMSKETLRKSASQEELAMEIDDIKRQSDTVH